MTRWRLTSLQTPRLHLRPITHDDIPRLKRLHDEGRHRQRKVPADAAVARALGVGGGPGHLGHGAGGGLGPGEEVRRYRRDVENGDVAAGAEPHDIVAALPFMSANCTVVVLSRVGKETPPTDSKTSTSSKRRPARLRAIFTWLPMTMTMSSQPSLSTSSRLAKGISSVGDGHVIDGDEGRPPTAPEVQAMPQLPGRQDVGVQQPVAVEIAELKVVFLKTSANDVDAGQGAERVFPRGADVAEDLGGVRQRAQHVDLAVEVDVDEARVGELVTLVEAEVLAEVGQIAV